MSKKDKIDTPRALHIAAYGLRTLAELPEVKATPEWSLELLEAAGHLDVVRRSLAAPAGPTSPRAAFLLVNL